MKPKTTTVFYTIIGITTLATAIIWGIDTMFLINAGLSRVEVFSIAAVFALAQVIFEVPTGIVADIKGRSRSFMLGCLVLGLATFLYLSMWWLKADFIWWAATSGLLGIGYTFFSGATEAWLVDSLKFEDKSNLLSKVLANGQAIGGVTMLTGALLGGFLAQNFGYSTPYIIRSSLLLFAFLIAYLFMKDNGFIPSQNIGWQKYSLSIAKMANQSIKSNPNIGFTMLSGAISSGSGLYCFYALQPYVLEIAKSNNLILAGATASLLACSMIIGGVLGSKFSHISNNPKQVLALSMILNLIVLAVIGVVGNLYVMLVAILAWGIIRSFVMPTRQTMLNSFIPSKERATLLSVDSLATSLATVGYNPALGKIASTYGFGASFVVAGLTQIAAVPFVAAIKLKNNK